MQTTTLGNTGLQISRLGAGLAEIGRLTPGDIDEASRVLNTALDGGINFLDTAACYGISEELIGRTISHRRHEYVLATKCGHVSGGYDGQPWTAKTVKDSIDSSLIRMNTDFLDIVQLHSCDVATLERGMVTQALQEAKESGKTRFVGYSGDNEAAEWAIRCDLFDTLQTSFNIVDQRARRTLFQMAEAKGMGIITKRPIANAVWGVTSSPLPYGNEYFQRAQAMSRLGPIQGEPEDRILMALGFVLAHSEVDTAIIGTRDSAHMVNNIQIVDERLPIAKEVVEELCSRFDHLGRDWVQLM